MDKQALVKELSEQLHRVLTLQGFTCVQVGCLLGDGGLCDYVYYSAMLNIELGVNIGENEVKAYRISTGEAISMLSHVEISQAVCYFTRGYHLAGRAGITHTAVPTQVQPVWLTAEQARRLGKVGNSGSLLVTKEDIMRNIVDAIQEGRTSISYAIGGILFEGSIVDYAALIQTWLQEFGYSVCVGESILQFNIISLVIKWGTNNAS